MIKPLVSVVMPSLNQVQFIEEAINSVLGQNYSNLELIVADGGSNDGTLALLQRKQSEDSRLRWFSEKDTGPANALNHALSKVRGTIIGWLNSDDLYTEGAIARAVAELNTHPQWMMVYGHGEHIDANGNRLDKYPTLPPNTPINRFADGCFICQPTVFFRRTQLVLLGKLNEELKTAFDFDYWLRAFSAFQHRIGFVSEVQAYSRLHGDCITLRMRRTVILEGMQVLARHLGYAPKEWFLTYVNELLKLPTEQQSVGDLKQHVTETLAVAKPWLTADDFLKLELMLAERKLKTE